VRFRHVGPAAEKWFVRDLAVWSMNP
jgi:hypothetical protein